MRANTSRGSWLWALALIALGVILLLDNFLFITSFDVSALLPLVLVVVGVIILLRGDLFTSSAGRTFGITRGSVEAVALEISAADIDVSARPLQREGRLIAGQYAPDSRPQLLVQETQAYLRMDRAATPFLPFVDWEIGLAHDLPWALFVTTSLGHAQIDLTGLIAQKVVVATGFGDIRFTCPQEAFEPIDLRSTLGSVHVLTPNGVNARITVAPSRLFSIRLDANRYEEIAPRVYQSKEPDPASPVVEVRVAGTFGDAYLA